MGGRPTCSSFSPEGKIPCSQEVFVFDYVVVKVMMIRCGRVWLIMLFRRFRSFGFVLQ
jgi:hypothetical protein